MKKSIFFLLSMILMCNMLPAQVVCKCDEVKFTITNWICKGKDAAGNPLYEGKLTVTNKSKCKFTLVNIMQQVGGDVAIPLPWPVAAASTGSATIVFTDHAPFVPVGGAPFFIVEFTLDNGKCKLEFPSDKIPKCPETCKCNDKGWDTLTAQVNNITKNVKCGFQFGITCADKVTLKGLYRCMGDCKATYTAVLKNTATNIVVQNYPSFSFPWTYTFAGPGTYSLEITPVCGTQKCQPCRFFFTVKDCNTTCDCNPDGWQTFEATTAGGVQKVKCGFQFGLKANETVKLNGKYTCKGNCNATYIATLKNNVTGVVIQNYNPFTFPWSHSFAAVGNYKLEITPMCGDKKCQSCSFFFTVK